MTLDPQTILNWKFPEIEHAYTEKDTILYALGLGCGSEPGEADDLKFVYERGLLALPTMAVVLAYPGNWLESRESTADYSKVLHGEQYLTLHRPLPPSGVVVGKTRVTNLLDKGKEKGAVLYVERRIVDKASGAPIATMISAAVLRGDGGFGGKPDRSPSRTSFDGAPARHVDIKTAPNAALIYRLVGRQEPAARRSQGRSRRRLQDADPAQAVHLRRGGRAIIKACCGGDPARLTGLQVRFSAPVFPGETIRTEMWPDASQVSFRARVVERDVVVLNNGLAKLAS
jgi:hypothetical protein